MTTAQRVLLIKTLAVCEDFRIVRELLREADPTFPDISDRTLRTYRGKKDKRTLALMEEALDEALTASVADKRRRIAELTQIYRRLTGRSWELDRLIALEQREWNALENPAMPAALRELREVDAQRGAVLRQLMAETGTQSGVISPAGTLPGDDLSDTFPDDVDDSYLEELIAEIINDRIASDEAMEFAAPMQALMDAVDLG